MGWAVSGGERERGELLLSWAAVVASVGVALLGWLERGRERAHPCQPQHSLGQGGALGLQEQRGEGETERGSRGRDHLGRHGPRGGKLRRGNSGPGREKKWNAGP